MSTRKHARTADSQSLLYDPDVPTPSHAERAHTLAAAVSTATLCTLATDLDSHPYGSFVTFGLDAGRPVFLISELAEHTRNLHGDSRSSLLVVEPGSGDPLARGRVTIAGRTRLLGQDSDDNDSARDAFLQRHPNAAYYVDFKDFHFWRMEVESLRYIGGYGRMSWIEAGAWLEAEPDPLINHADRIIRHMNEDHSDALVACCRAFSRANEATEVVMTGVDRYGFEMSVQTEAGPRPVRLAFDEEVLTPAQARTQLVALTRRARG